MSFLKFENVNFKNTDGLLTNFSLEINKGEIHAIVAKNTIDQLVFLDSIMQLHNKNLFSGKVILDYIDISDTKINYLNKIKIMYNKIHLVENLSVSENLFLNNFYKFPLISIINWSKLYKLTIKNLSLFGLNFSPKTFVKDLSIEEKKIVYLLKQLITEPKILILQEPFEDLNPITLSKVKEVLRNYSNNGNSVIIITKNWEHSLRLSDHISILSNGNIINSMSTVEASKNPTELVKRIENIHITDTEEDSNQLIEAIFKASEFLTSEYELNEILNYLIKEAITAFNASSGSIILFDELSNTVIDEFISNSYNYPSYIIKNSTLTKVISSRHIQSLSFENNIFRTIYLVPIYLKKQVHGIMQLNFLEQKEFQSKEINYLESFARHIALAMDDTRLMGSSIYIRESHHRIKNNLQTITHLINLKKQSLVSNKNQTINEVLDDITSYIKSISIVHDLISKDYYGRSIFNLRDMVNSLIDALSIHPNIVIHKKLEDQFISYNKASSITLIINELISNSFKHAFDPIIGGEIFVETFKSSENLSIIIKDTGKGFPDSFIIEKHGGLGLTILQNILNSEFKGEINILPSTIGASIQIKIPLNKLFIDNKE